MIQPIGKRVALLMLPSPTVSAGGIQLPDNSQKADRAQVVALGTGGQGKWVGWNHYVSGFVFTVKVGDIVIVPKYADSHKMSDGVFILKESDILAIYVKDTPEN